MRIEDLLEINPRLLSTSLFDILAMEGFYRSYPTVVRQVRAARPALLGHGQRLGADRDGPGRGMPVRLVGLGAPYPALRP